MNLLSDFRTPRAGEAPQPSFISFNILLIFVALLPGSPPQLILERLGVPKVGIVSGHVLSGNHQIPGGLEACA